MLRRPTTAELATRTELDALRAKARDLLDEHPAFERGRQAETLEILELVEAELAQLRIDEGRGMRTSPVLFASLLVDRLRRRLGVTS